MNKAIHFFKNKVKYTVEDRAILVRWITGVIKDRNKIPGDINFIITSDKSLLEINLKYLNTDTYTDIITFTLSEEEGIISGDVYISIERIKENAKKYDIEQVEEFRRIVVHGVLHLLGYNDLSTSEKRQMTRLENKYLSLYPRT
ncbi:MAG: rRNA maturation RNase YbeY [Bacteroidota bacterium]|jgi:probable rRNA maturation factor